MSSDNRYAMYLRAEVSAHLALAKTFSLSPHYDNNEKRRAELIASYVDMADSYARMAADHERQEASE